jgi:hypothetical protein
MKDSTKVPTIRKAIELIPHPDLQRDFANLADGIDYAFNPKQYDAHLAMSVMSMMADVAFALNKTISPQVMIKVLDAITDEAENHGVHLRPRENHMKCVRGGNCEPDVGSDCYHVGTGCSTSAGVVFWRWE